MSWDPKTYLSFESERTRPAAELLARIPVEKAAHVIDLGCGPGNSTALLARRWPEAALEGLDSSAPMLGQAKGSGINAHWIESDVSAWKATRPYDVIFSNAALQWVPDHEHLLPRLMRFLARDGVLAFQVPRNFGEPSHTILHDLSEDARWRDKLAGARDWWNVRTMEEYYALLEPHAATIDIWETRYLQILDGEDAVYRWTSGTGARPFIDALSGAARDAFVAEYKSRLLRAYPPRANGRTLFPFQRLFAVARR